MNDLLEKANRWEQHAKTKIKEQLDSGKIDFPTALSHTADLYDYRKKRAKQRETADSAAGRGAKTYPQYGEEHRYEPKAEPKITASFRQHARISIPESTKTFKHELGKKHGVPVAKDVRRKHLHAIKRWDKHATAAHADENIKPREEALKERKLDIPRKGKQIRLYLARQKNQENIHNE